MAVRIPPAQLERETVRMIVTMVDVLNERSARHG